MFPRMCLNITFYVHCLPLFLYKNALDYSESHHPPHEYRFSVFCVGNTPKPKKHLDIKCILCGKRTEAEESFEH